MADIARDDDVILHNPDFKQLVAVIDTSGFNPHYGTPRNPYDIGRYTGGSSSGSGAAGSISCCSTSPCHKWTASRHCANCAACVPNSR